MQGSPHLPDQPEAEGHQPVLAAETPITDGQLPERARPGGREAAIQAQEPRECQEGGHGEAARGQGAGVPRIQG